MSSTTDSAAADEVLKGLVALGLIIQQTSSGRLVLMLTDLGLAQLRQSSRLRSALAALGTLDIDTLNDK